MFDSGHNAINFLSLYGGTVVVSRMRTVWVFEKMEGLR